MCWDQACLFCFFFSFFSFSKHLFWTTTHDVHCFITSVVGLALPCLASSSSSVYFELQPFIHNPFDLVIIIIIILIIINMYNLFCTNYLCLFRTSKLFTIVLQFALSAKQLNNFSPQLPLLWLSNTKRTEVSVCQMYFFISFIQAGTRLHWDRLGV